MNTRLFLLPVTLLLGGCIIHTAPDNLPQERLRYNDVVRITEDEQLLSNIVRLRYNDTPFFLDLGSIVVQYSQESQASAGGELGLDNFIDGSPGEGLGLFGGSVTLGERPTVSYSPLQGEDYARRMLTPIPLEVVWLLANSGWSIERLMVLSVERAQNIDNAPTASGPHPRAAPLYADFRELAVILRRLQQNQVLIVTTQNDADGRPLLTVRFDLSRHPESSGDVARMLELMDFPAGTDELVLGTTSRDLPDIDYGILRTRSLLGVLYFIANSISAPQEHVEEGLVRVAMTPQNQAFDWQEITGGIIDIRHSATEPEYASVKTRYRDYWFYVDDRDADSKSTFALLQLLFSLQSTSGSGLLPLLTLPAG